MRTDARIWIGVLVLAAVLLLVAIVFGTNVMADLGHRAVEEGVIR